jgi:hypothetical protein
MANENKNCKLMIIRNDYLFKKEFIAGEFLLPIMLICAAYVHMLKSKLNNDTLDLLYCEEGIVLWAS